MPKENIINAILHGTGGTAPLTTDKKKEAVVAALLNREPEAYLEKHQQAIRQGLYELLEERKKKKMLGYYTVSPNVAEFIIAAQHWDVSMGHSQMGDDEVIAIADILKTNTAIKTLFLSNNKITPKGAAAIATALEENSSLREISFNGNNLGDKGVAAFGKILRKNTPLAHVSLGNNNITDRGIDTLLDMVKTNTSLAQLQIGDNPASDEKKEQLKKRVRDNFEVGRTILCRNVEKYVTGPDITDTNTEIFTEGLHKSSLHFLNVSNTTINEEGMGALIQMVKGSDRISDLNFHNVIMDEKAVAQLEKLLRPNDTHMRYLVLNHCDISDTSVAGLLAVARTNTSIMRIDISNNAGTSQETEKAFENAPKLRDAVTDYTHSIVVPLLVKFLNADPTVTDRDKEDFVLDKQSITALNRITAQHLFAGLSDKQIEAFSEHWHQALPQIKSQKLKDYNGITWEPLLGEKETAIPAGITGASGWKLVALTTPTELEAEGKALQHCVGGYTARCGNEDSHILAVVGPDGKSRSTIEIKTDYNHRTYEVVQHFGMKNKAPAASTPNAKALEWLKAQLDTGKSTIAYESLYNARHERLASAKTLEHKVMQTIGFNPVDPEKQRAITTLYGDEMLPPKKADEKLRAQMKKNFDSLKNIMEIDLGSLQIGTKSHFSAPVTITVENTSKKVKRDTGGEKDTIRRAIQRSADALFGKNNVGVGMETSTEGEEFIILQIRNTSPIGVEAVAHKMAEILGNEEGVKQLDGRLHIVGLAPATLSLRLKQVQQNPGLYTNRVSTSNIQGLEMGGRL